MDHDFAPTTFDIADEAGPADAVATPGRFQAWLQRFGIETNSALRDVQTRLFNRQGLLSRGQRLLAGTRSGEGALVLFDFSDLLELRGIYGSKASAAALALLVGRLERLAGRGGLAARTGPAQFGVLLPESCRQSAIDATHRLFGKPCRLELELGREEIVLVPDVVVDTCDDEPGALAQLYTQLSVNLGRHRDHEERRRHKLRRERERHSRFSGFSHSARDSLPASLPAD
ncbi:MAG: diguanylate cyclase domain-containing protein [Ramlibacter sp.]